MPPWTMAIYPSSLFYHFNVDVKGELHWWLIDRLLNPQLDIQFVTTDSDAQPTPENTRPVKEGDREGRGSMVFFNQATMRTLPETGEDTLIEATDGGHSGTSDFKGTAQEIFSRTEFYHSYHY